MSLRLAISFLLLASGAASAQGPMTPPPSDQWPGVEIVEGVAFQGDGSITIEAGSGGLPVIAYWRPILFREDSRRPYAGRMDCRVIATDGAFSEEEFDPDAKHAMNADLRESQGYIDEDMLRDLSDTVRQLDVVGRRNAPHQHYVLSYILVRDGARLIDIRRNCTFVHDASISRVDVLPYIYRSTKLTYAFEPGTGDEG